MIPGIIKGPFVSSLQGCGINVYKMPVLSSERKDEWVLLSRRWRR